MSNKEALKVYDLIIENVINEVRQDFENNGVDEDTLLDLKKIWQEQLTKSKVSENFPWDSENSATTTVDNQNKDGDEPIQIEIEVNGNNNVPNSIDTTTKEQMKKEEENEVNTNNGDENEINSKKSDNDAEGGEEEAKAKDNEQRESELERLKRLKQKEKEAKKTALLETDEVNSDLDDSDDDYLNSDDEANPNGGYNDNGDGPSSNGNIILCLYDKVGRVRNKWKCTLRDGLASIDGKDYAFQKANGECEW
ncbi:related to Transcription initiation factor IIA large subunit [Saccharomycodes ludwigii]|uniref:Transcription initiation factor IIA large subunit n=1 Tax=Saccharomycodes ludwigii TaxID=36035 RepID=A0A376B6Z7_9ASCO|nr:hypothetical protein SCDLUD_002076 [Saccharomycodes ludwigii]KAH3902259.1 hypothetical protein SCDLUD_002076 [Saccharomycodes ludwigii]SSD60453.1 related to Transcription initiation factor IIA large subunit [Saccharomycodes ludwigii]